MEPVTISDARRFSLSEIQRNELVAEGDLRVALLCFEAGQRDEETKGASDRLYQVLEGEALVRHDGESRSIRLGKGKLLRVPSGTKHRLENAGGGLLVVIATSCG